MPNRVPIRPPIRSLNPIVAQLRDLRQRQGLNQETIAERIGCITRTIRCLEQGLTRRQNLALLQAYANILGYELQLCPLSKPTKPT